MSCADLCSVVQHVVCVDDPVGVALVGEEALTVSCEVGVDGVARDHAVEVRGAAVDLGPQDSPEASVATQVSGTFGSRQEEAQRLGRILRPKVDGRTAHFYSVVSRDTVDADFAAHRQRFLAEQGYSYRIIDADDLLNPTDPT